jgi:flagellar motor switch protein FliN/FliY
VADDLLKPEEIEALLKAAGPSPRQPGGAAAGGGDPANQPPITARSAMPKPAAKSKSTTERLIEQAEAGLAAAIAPNLHAPNGIPQELGSAAPFQFQSFEPAGAGAGAGDGVGLNALQDVELDLRIELGRTDLLIEEVLQLREGSVVPLNKLAGDPVDILVNGRLVARGEVLVLNDNFCVRVAEIVAPTL